MAQMKKSKNVKIYNNKKAKKLKYIKMLKFTIIKMKMKTNRDLNI